LVSGSPEGLRPQDLARRTPVEVPFGVVGELLLAEIGPCFARIGQGHVGPDAGALYGGDVLYRAVGGVSGDLLRMELPPEAGAPEQVEHRRILGDLEGRDQDIEDDAGLAAVHHVVGVVAKMRTLALPAFHRGRVGVGRARQEVRLTPVPYVLLLAPLAPVSRDPVVVFGVLGRERLVVGGRQFVDSAEVPSFCHGGALLFLLCV
jgi:hypothetical protein